MGQYFCVFMPELDGTKAIVFIVFLALLLLAKTLSALCMDQNKTEVYRRVCTEQNNIS